jgi:shikimate kinase
VDTDDYIVREQGMSINDIFEKYGEAYFRDLETETIKKLSEKLTGTVIATGGGLPVKKENEKWLKALGRVYYLKATVDIIYGRVCGDTERPLLKTENLRDKITKMLDAREERYMECADEIIELTEALSVPEIAERIICGKRQ